MLVSTVKFFQATPLFAGCILARARACARVCPCLIAACVCLNAHACICPPPPHLIVFLDVCFSPVFKCICCCAFHPDKTGRPWARHPGQFQGTGRCHVHFDGFWDVPFLRGHRWSLRLDKRVHEGIQDYVSSWEQPVQMASNRLPWQPRLCSRTRVDCFVFSSNSSKRR